MVEKNFLDSLTSIFERDLGKLHQEISSYRDESSLWKVRGEISNSGGNLCLHICGNLQHYIGHILGGIEYSRNRENEFAARNIPRERLLGEVSASRAAVSGALQKLDGSELGREYPIHVFDHPMTTLYFLVHLQGHLNYHLGQINYHRRLMEK